MKMSGLVTLITDFGTKDPYGGITKGMIYEANKEVRIVDITHDIQAHDVLSAAFTLVRAYEYFPEGTVHVAIVDPEVGSKQRSIAVQTEQYMFVGPDNGIFTMVYEKEKNKEVREINNLTYVHKRVSSTFHGRDIYAPCAGHLSAGRDFTDIGPVVKDYKKIVYPEVIQDGNILKGEIVSIDSFGNLISNIPIHKFKSFVGKRKISVSFATVRFNKIMDHYSEVPKGSPLALFGSSGHLEISMNEGSASYYFMTSVGSTITIRRS